MEIGRASSIAMCKEGLTYDDVQLVPKFSGIESRNNIKIETEIVNGFRIHHPLIPANMDTISSIEMVKTTDKYGGVCFLHRFNNTTKLFEDLHTLVKGDIRIIGVSLGVKEEDKHTANNVYNFLKRVGLEHRLIFLIDVAHGHHILVLEMISHLKKQFPLIPIIAGNVVTISGAYDLCRAGADAIKCGVGPGSNCTTRINTGFGVPQFSAISNVKTGIEIYCDESNIGYNEGPKIIADGGIKYIGDIVKAIGAGANTVMSGYLFAGTSDTPGSIISKGLFPNETHWKVYRGSASRDSKLDRGETRNIEGTSVEVPYRGETSRVFEESADGIKSGLSYGGYNKLMEAIGNMQFCRVSSSSIIEAGPTALYKYGR